MGTLKKVLKYGVKAGICAVVPAATPYVIAQEVVSKGVEMAVRDGNDDKFSKGLGKTAKIIFGDASIINDD